MDISHIEKRKCTPLTLSILENDEKVFQQCLEHSPNEATKSDGNELTPLLSSALYGRTALAKQLLKRGVEPNFGADILNSSLDLELIEEEVSNSASYRAKHTYNSLRLAIAHNHIHTACLLLEYGADVNLLEFEERVDLLQAACDEGHEKLVSFLLNKHLNANTPLNELREPAMFFAVRKDNMDMVKHLIRQNADINIQNQLHQTPLFFAISAKMTLLLLENGARFSLFCDDHQPTAFTKALEEHRLEVANELIKWKRKALIDGLKQYCSFASNLWRRGLVKLYKWYQPKQAIVFDSLVEEQQQSIQAIISNIKNTIEQKNLRIDNALQSLLILGEAIAKANHHYRQTFQKPNLETFQTLNQPELNH